MNLVDFIKKYGKTRAKEFDVIDVDKSGTITLSEYFEAQRSIKANINEEHINKYWGLSWSYLLG